MARILAVDLGEKRIGLAVSDPTGMIANPLGVISHVNRLEDAQQILRRAAELGVDQIVIGQPLDGEGNEGRSARHARVFAEALQALTALPVILWDESGSTQAARQARIALGASRKKRSGHLDDLAATYILQTYLDRM